ncbi:hypothetical protein Ade02nite_28460 [Paractinoplanes deccanensis]|uniref:non-specific serine/threonine protein kinase n=1 Tax=Paractinoplanes deccanensis TaxID=113561 RepID=A0ABQ3Y2V6_9ACTN|nr:FhaA domain-containing protein [Actinoplanes deccanensis]GID74205.1 hypothetical protein Ade02nite_28460 [Actinoplanes deccanensis]
MRTEALVETLRRAGLAAEALEVAEALWLASTIEELTALGTAMPAQPVAPSPTVEVAPLADEPDDEPMLDLTEAVESLREEPVFEGAPLHVPVAGEPEAVEVAGSAVPVRQGPALPSRGALLRALRPLKRRIDTGRLEVLDEDATAQRIADGGPFSPVLRAAQERWLDAVVVADRAPSMGLWTGVAEELLATLRQLGAFRDVRLWHLVHDGADGPAIIPESTADPSGNGTRSPSELVDFSGRRVFLVLTDATADVWRTGSAAKVLTAWSQRGYVTIVQPLPERLWPRTALRVRNGTFLSFRPGTFTSEQTFVERRRRPRGLRDDEIPVPVVELRPAWFASWSRTVAGSAHGGVEMAAAILSPASAPDATPGDERRPDEATTLVGTYFATASPEACRLATCLAAVPLDLRVIRLVQRVMVPASGPAHIAEVLLSGLLHRVGADETLHRFEFRPGVRDLLLNELRVSDMRQVVQAVSEYVSANAGLSDATFEAVATMEGGAAAAVAERPFAWMPMELVRRLTPPVTRTPSAPEPLTGAGIGEGMVLGGRYRLRERVGVSMLGEVWRGTDEVLNRTITVQVLSPALLGEPNFADVFRTEARALATIRHPAVVPVHDIIVDQDGAFLVMKLVEGEPLDDALSRAGRLAPTDTMALIAQAADALQAMHVKGLVHGSIHSGSFLIVFGNTLMLTGLVTARIMRAATAIATSLDPVPFEANRSPEQFSGEVATPVSDVYALGVIAYECLSGRPPFAGRVPVEIAIGHVRDTPPPLPPEIPPNVRSLVERAMAKDPADRWPSAGAMAAAARLAAESAEDTRPVPSGDGLIAPGVVLGGRYRLDQQITVGGERTTWRGTDEVFGRPVNVEVFPPAPAREPGFAERFSREARVLARINHPGLVDVFDYGIGEHFLFLVTVYVEGDALSHTLSRAGRMTPDRAMALVAQAAEALQAAHEFGVVHRDVNPGNLLIRPDGTLVVTGFGLGRTGVLGEGLSEYVPLGTALYASPEQASGEVATPASDVYALSAIAYRCLTGEPPFAGATPDEVASMHQHDAPPPLPADVPPRMRSILQEAMAKEPSRRPTAAAVAAAAREAVGSRPSTDDEITPPYPYLSEATDRAAAVRPVGGPPAITWEDASPDPRDAVRDIESEVDRTYPSPRRRFLRRNLSAVAVLRTMVGTAERYRSPALDYTPNHFVVSMAEEDFLRFMSWDPPVMSTFPRYLDRIFQARGWYLINPVRVEFRLDTRMKSPGVQVSTE